MTGPGLFLKALFCLSSQSYGIAFRAKNYQPTHAGVGGRSSTRICCGALKRSSTTKEASVEKKLPTEAPAVNRAVIDPSITEWADRPLELDSWGKIMLKGLLFSELQQLMTNIGEKPGRAEILCGWLYHSGRLVRDVEETSGANSGHGDSFQRHRIGWKTRENIRACATADGGLELEDVQLAADGTRKMVSILTCGEGEGKKIETVIIPMLRGPQRKPRYTVCVSSQVGCAMNCQFCYTGRLGLMAHLQTAQIVEQVISAKRYLESVGDPAPVSGVVFMGMGEPFDNYERVMRAVKILTDSRAGVRLKASKVTVSTVGLVPAIERFCTDPENGASLAISLHTVSDEVRDQVIPINRRYPLGQLGDSLRKHFPRRPEPQPTWISAERSESHCPDSVPALGFIPVPKKRRRVNRILAVEYTLMRGVNDSPADAERLAEWLKGISCVVNLITFNPHDGTPFSRSSVATLKAFREVLLERGQLCTYRDSRGDDGMAACGQLGGESMHGRGTRPPVAVKWKPTV